MPIRFDHPSSLWYLLLAVPVVILGLRSRASLNKSRQWSVIGPRIGVITLLVLMLAGAQAVYWHRDLTVVVVLDQSESVRRLGHGRDVPKPPPIVRDREGPVPREEQILDWVRQSAADHKPNDRIGMVTFDGRPVVQDLPSSNFDLGAGSFATPTDGTDIAAAIRLALALFTADSAKRIVLVSDGNQTITAGGEDDQSVSTAAQEARAAGIPIDVLPITYRLENEVIVDGLYAPIEARQGQTVALRVVLRASEPATGWLYLKHDGNLVSFAGPSGDTTAIAVEREQWVAQPSATDQAANPYLWAQKIELPLAHSGANSFHAVFEPRIPGPAGGDTILANNQAQAITFVHGKTRVLLVGRPHPGQASTLATTLGLRGLDVDVVTPDVMPAQMPGLLAYDAVMLQNIPAESINGRQQERLAEYVRDLGGGLVMIGGPDAFGAGGWTHSPVDRVLPVDCQIPNEKVLPSGALLLVLDRSGSMGESVTGAPYTKQQIANEAAVLALSTLYPQDMVGVIAFDNGARWIVRLQSNTDPSAVAKEVRRIRPGGGTDIYPALEKAYEALAGLDTQDPAVKHIILLTDGQSRHARFHELADKISRSGISISTIGVGDDVNDGLLASLAATTGGAYYPVSDPDHLPRVFIKEARTVRRNLIKEMPFSPRVVPTGSPIMAGIDTVPQLDGFVRTGRKPKDRVYTPIIGPEGEPIFAHWQVGLGRAAAFTSDATSRWSTHWLNWSGYADFWLRTTRAIARPTASGDHDLLLSIRQGRLHIRLDTTIDTVLQKSSATGQPLRVVGTVLEPNGQTTTVRLAQSGPGTYETDLPAPAEGSYLVTVLAQPARPPSAGGAHRHLVVGGISQRRGSELRDLGSNQKQLEQIATITGGKILDRQQPASLFDRRTLVASRSLHPVWHKLMPWLLALFLVDVAARRLAWSPASLWRWAIQRVETWRGLTAPRTALATQTLAALKQRAAEVDGRLTATGPDAPQARSPGQTPQAGDRTTSQSDSPTAQPTGIFEPSAVSGPHEPTTQRLLDAKRRVRARAMTDRDPAGPDQD